MTEPIRIYRCKKCGKWSHAQRKPTFHKRTVSGLEEPDTEGLPVLESIVDPVIEHDGVGWAHIDDAYLVTLRCGPFATYSAELVE